MPSASAAADTQASVAVNPEGAEGLVAWRNEMNGDEAKGQIAARRFDTTANFVKSNGYLFQLVPNGVQSQPAIVYSKEDVVGSAWVESTGADSSDVKLIAINVLSDKAFKKSIQSANKNTQFQRSRPQIVDRGSKTPGVTLVWETQSAPGGKGIDIVTRSFDLGYDDKIGFIFQATMSQEEFVNSNPGSDDTNPNQEKPSLIRLTDGTFVVGWEDQLANNSLGGVFARKLTKSGQPSGPTFQLNKNVENTQSDIRLAALDSGGFVAVWTTKHQDAGDVVIGMYTADGTPVSADLNEKFVAGKSETGVQRNADVATFGGDRVLVVWNDDDKEKQGNPASGALAGIYMVQLGADLNPQGVVIHVNTNHVPGDQLNPTVTRAGTSEKPWALVTYEDTLCHEGTGSPLPCVYRRPFEVKSAICTPDCKGKDCGPDGCGSSCGECPVGQQCTEQHTCIDS